MSETKIYPYDVALSFAGTQREYALELAQKLRQCHLDVFYDNWYIEDLWGNNLARALPSVYVKKPLFCVCLFSKEYNSRVYPRMEFEHMQYRQYEDEGYILPIVMDGSIPDEWPKMRGYICSEDYTIDEIALIIREKVIRRKKMSNQNVEDIIQEKRRMTIISDGKEEEIEFLVSWKFNDTNTEYMVYTKNEADEHGDITIYVSGIERNEENEPILTGVPDEEWGRIKKVLQELSQDLDDIRELPNGDFKTRDGTDLLSN